MDLPPESRHLDLYLAQMTLLDKNCQAYALGRVRTVDCVEMTCIAHGITREELAHEAAVMAIVNTNSPMQLDIPMTEAVVELASAGQVVLIALAAAVRGLAEERAPALAGLRSYDLRWTRCTRRAGADRRS